LLPGSSIPATLSKTYTGSLAGSFALDGKSPLTVDAQVNAMTATSAALITYPVNNFVIGAKSTYTQLLLSEAFGQSLSHYVTNVGELLDAPRSNGFMCVQ